MACWTAGSATASGASNSGLAWDYLGGRVAIAPDLGAEPGLHSNQPDTALGPWGHRVSNYAVDGTSIGFLDFFQAIGGCGVLRLSKTEARDDALGAELPVPNAPSGVIRQYFQAGVLE